MDKSCFNCEFYCDTPFVCPVLRTARVESDEQFLEFHFYCYFFKSHAYNKGDDD